jgi:ABC-type phosphate/phosphonate transport system ATPase subunit
LTREYADRVIGLKEGQIAFDGLPQELSNAVVDLIYQRDG